MKKLLNLFAFFCFQFVFAQLPNVAFNGSNAWSTNANITFDTGLNQATINGNGTNNVRTSLDANLTSNPSVFYFVVDVFLANVVHNPSTILNPQIIVRDNSNVVLKRVNLAYGLHNQWFKTGIKIENYPNSLIKLEVGVNNTTGTMIVRNPILTTIEPSFTYEFPYAVPSNTNSSLNVNLTQKHNFQNDLLSTNSHFVYATYQWGNANLNNAINTYFPMSNIRFPGGTVGNYYNYQTDTFYLNATTPNNLYNAANSGYVFNYNGYKDLVINSNATSTLMFNVFTNTPAQSKTEYQNRLASGLPVKWIEIGNEMYASENQTGPNITDVATYISHAQQFSTELKSVNPNVKVAVCLDKDEFNAGSWNHSIAQNQNYFDAATLHNYISTGSFFFNKYDAYAAYNTYRISTKRFLDYANQYPNKPLLLTEWGILNEIDEPMFMNTIGIADAFLAIEKANQNGIVEQAGIHMLYKNDANSEATLMFKGAGNQIRLTSKGVLYSKLFEVFKNSEVFNADVVSVDLETDLKAIYGKMVKKGTNYKVFLVNKLPVTSSFNLSVNSMPFNGNYTLESYSQNMDNVVSDIAAGTNVWNTTNGSGSITLPPSSINVITIPESAIITLSTRNNEIMKDKIQLFPNPTSTIININNDSEYNLILFEIFDLTGKKIYSSNEVNQKSIDLSKFSSGLYTLKMTNDKNVSIIKKVFKN